MLEYVEFAKKLADTSGGVIKRYFRSNISVEDKVDKSPVTVADRETELVLRKMITEKYPEHDILGEEFGFNPSGSIWRWVLDPIDGTRSFILGIPIFGTLISLIENEIPQLGIIDIPITGERWVGINNKETIFYSKKKIKKTIKCRVSDQKSIEESSLIATDPGMFNSIQKPFFDNIAAIVKRVRFGGDCYNYGLLASGFIDLVVEADMKLFDVIALVPVVEEAGGIISDWQGNSFFNEEWNGCVLAAASKELHDKALEILNKK